MDVEKRETASGSSDVEGIESGAEDSNVAAAIIPKKRGRPSKGVKTVKKPSGRGRGRPLKIVNTVADGSEDSDVAVENGKKAGRGRSKSGAQKSIVASGKGRGRPKSAVKRSAEDAVAISGKKRKSTGGKRGRPRKGAQASDDDVSTEDVDEEVEVNGDVMVIKAKIGRPSVGANSLNILRSGRGQGRPKKDGSGKRRGRRPYKAAAIAKESADNAKIKDDDEEGEDGEEFIDDKLVESVDGEEEDEKIVLHKTIEEKRNKLAAA